MAEVRTGEWRLIGDFETTKSLMGDNHITPVLWRAGLISIRCNVGWVVHCGFVSGGVVLAETQYGLCFHSYIVELHNKIRGRKCIVLFYEILDVGIGSL